MPDLEFIPLPPLTDAQVQAGARPGESWAQARARLEAGNLALPPAPVPQGAMEAGADCIGSGWITECYDPETGQLLDVDELASDAGA